MGRGVNPKNTAAAQLRGAAVADLQPTRQEIDDALDYLDSIAVAEDDRDPIVDWVEDENYVREPFDGPDDGMRPVRASELAAMEAQEAANLAARQVQQAAPASDEEIIAALQQMPSVVLTGDDEADMNRMMSLADEHGGVRLAGRAASDEELLAAAEELPTVTLTGDPEVDEQILDEVDGPVRLEAREDAAPERAAANESRVRQHVQSTYANTAVDTDRLQEILNRRNSEGR